MENIKNEIISFAKTILIALIFAGLIRSFLFEPFHIPSGSMKPNLLVGDYIVVSKYTYGYSRFSFPFGFDLFEGRIFGGEQKKPQRGDVVVFRYTKDTSINYIKRIVGMSGDVVQMIDGVLFINNKAVEKIADGEFYDDQENQLPSGVARFEEVMPDGKKIKTLDMQDAPQDNTGIYTVPKGHYFVMGDNRDNSQDSRFLSELGFVPEQNIIGKARFIFFSINKPVWQFWQYGNSIRFNRIFSKIN